MSDLYKLDTWRALVSSWKLLVPATAIAFALWLMPGVWIKDVAVISLRDQYRGHLGFAAIALAIISSFKAMYEIKNLVAWFLKRKRDKAEEYARRQKIFRKIELLGQAERDLLQSCADTDNPLIECPRDSIDPRVKSIQRLGIVTVVEYDYDLPNAVFRVQPWVLEEFKRRSSK